MDKKEHTYEDGRPWHAFTIATACECCGRRPPTTLVIDKNTDYPQQLCETCWEWWEKDTRSNPQNPYHPQFPQGDPFRHIGEFPS